jgi:hypothetical protein
MRRERKTNQLELEVPAIPGVTSQGLEVGLHFCIFFLGRSTVYTGLINRMIESSPTRPVSRTMACRIANDSEDHGDMKDFCSAQQRHYVQSYGYLKHSILSTDNP